MIPDAIFHRLFRMPELPPHPPIPGGLPVVREGFALFVRWATACFGLVFRAGVEQGFLAGCVFTLMVIQGLSLARSRKER